MILKHDYKTVCEKTKEKICYEEQMKTKEVNLCYCLRLYSTILQKYEREH